MPMQLGSHSSQRLANRGGLLPPGERMGKQKATMAVAHLLIRMIYVVLRDKVPYQELGANYLGNREKSMEYRICKINLIGYEVELRNLATA